MWNEQPVYRPSRGCGWRVRAGLCHLVCRVGLMLPKRIPKSERLNAPKRVRSPSHCKWVREHSCCVPNCDARPIEAAHVRTGTMGGTGIKPGDDWTISLCSYHHARQHAIGERVFEKAHGIDMKALAQEFARKSPKLKRIKRNER